MRTSLLGLLDQRRPFGRLALVHCLQAAGTTFVTISLAKSLFFSISPDAAESRVLLYLLITIAPFAVVGPALSPLLDRGRQARRSSVAVANLGSALTCIGMGRDLHNLLLFPEAFIVLVLGKLYLVARAAIVPETLEEGDDLATVNARLAMLASLSGLVVFPVAVGLLKLGASWALFGGAVVFIAGGIASMRLPRPTSTASVEVPGSEAQLALRPSEVTEQRRELGLPLYRYEVRSALSAVTVARATVGFVEFFLAFELRREHAATWWFGLLLGASAVGSLAGSVIVPQLRRYLSERQIILASLVAIVVGSLGAGLIGGLLAQALLTLVVGVAPTSAKPALDSIVQRHVAPALLGRAFGRTETRLQLAWVGAALLGTVIPFPLRIGDGVVALACLLAALSYALVPHAPSRVSRVRT